MSMIFDRPLTNYLVNTWNMWVYAWVCFRYDNVCNCNNCAVITKVARVGHELCQLALLQIRAIQPQLDPHGCSAVFLSLAFFPIVFHTAAIPHPFPFPQFQKNIPVYLFHTGRWPSNILYSDWSYPVQTPTSWPSLDFGDIVLLWVSIFPLLTSVPPFTLDIELPYSYLWSLSPS